MNPRTRLIRKEILRALRVAGEYGATAGLIAQTLLDGGWSVTIPEIERHLAYLGGRGKEYIDVQTLDVEGFGRRTRAQLTPKGIDLLEGNIDPDPGVA